MLHWLDDSELLHTTTEMQEEMERQLRQWPVVLRYLHKMVMFTIEFGAFFLQFIQWWYVQEVREQPTTLKLPTPPAPENSPDQPRRCCPLCRSSQFQTPTLLPVCGFVFCYKCIWNHLSQYQNCPLTGLPAHTRQLIIMH